MSEERIESHPQTIETQTIETVQSGRSDEQDISLQRLTIYIGLAKFVATLFFGTVLTSIITGFISYKEVAIKEKESQIQLELSERQELSNYFEYTIGTRVYDRLKLSNFFGHILTDEDARERWNQYRSTQEELLNQYIEYDWKVKEINEMPESSRTESHIFTLSEHRKLEELLEPVAVVRNNLGSSISDLGHCTLPSGDGSDYVFDQSLLANTVVPNGYFSWADVTKGGTRLPNSQALEDRIRETAEELESIRDSTFPGEKVVVTSWYRDPEVNRKIGGASKSRHLCGDAVAFYIEGSNPVDTFNNLKEVHTTGGLALGSGFVHIDFREGSAVRWFYPGAPSTNLW